MGQRGGQNDGLVEGEKKYELLQLLDSNDKKGKMEWDIGRGCMVSRFLLAFELLKSL